MPMLQGLPSPVRFLFGAGLCLLASLAAMAWLAPRGWTDHPRGRRQHARPTPRTGGIAAMATVGLGLLLGGVRLPLGGWEWAVAFAMGLMGLADDRLDLRARWKALASLAGAGVLTALTWGVLRGAGDHLPLFLGQLATKTGLAAVLMVAWYWSIPQACNLIDGMNGLALGFFLLLAISMDLPLGAGGRGAYLMGALVALLALNFPRGRQFLGDSGALFLGTLFAILGVHLLAVQSPNHLLWAFAYPIVDVLLVMSIRRANGRPLGEGDRNHFHHQWQRRLPGRPLTVWALTLAPALACMQVMQDYPGHRAVAWAGGAWLAGCAGWFYRRSRASVPARPPSRSRTPVELEDRWAEPSGPHRVA
ncbi:MAG TPA: MraY family glycosyltransferase [Holophagaceae bacterium]|nr:MraY family glycosyltransferase [Holophagaceae bacterium]